MTTAARIDFNRENGAFGKRWFPETMGGGGAFLDYDNDGNLDILLVNGDWWPGHSKPGNRPTLRLYRNNGDGTFTDVTKQAGLDVSIQGMGVAVGDYDNDGFDDIYITAVGGNRLFHNEGGKRFREVTAQAGVGGSGWSTSAAWLDYDNDGKLDLFVCHYVKWTPETDKFCGSTVKTYCLPAVYEGETSRLYHNEGGGKFRDVTDKAGVRTANSKALGVAVSDIDGDGYPDIVVANDMVPNQLFKNLRNGRFKEQAMDFGLAVGDNGQAHAAMGIDTSYCLDGSHFGLAMGMFTNDGLFFYEVDPQKGTIERRKQTGLEVPSVPYITFGLLFSDFDLDGRPDLFITNGHLDDLIKQTSAGEQYEQPCQVFRNLGGGKFQDAGRGAGAAVTRPTVGRGLCVGDFDNDGKPDVLLIPNKGPCALLRNESPAKNHWVSILLHGTRSNRDGYGATITVRAGDTNQTAYARSGSSYLSASDRRLHFGLGAQVLPLEVMVKWPSGITEKFENIQPDRVVSLTEGTGSR